MRQVVFKEKTSTLMVPGSAAPSMRSFGIAIAAAPGLRVSAGGNGESGQKVQPRIKSLRAENEGLKGVYQEWFVRNFYPWY